MPIVSLPLASTLTNGNTADAGQVTTDLLQIATGVNANAAANGVNNDITQLTALTVVTSNVTFNSGLTLPSAIINNPTITGGSIDGTTVGVTQAVGTNNTTLATMAALIAQAFATALPSQATHSGQSIITNGSTASWGVSTVPGGGTGISTFTVGDILYASGTTTLSKLSAGATGTVLTCNGAGVAPSYQVTAIPDYLLMSVGVF